MDQCFHFSGFWFTSPLTFRWLMVQASDVGTMVLNLIVLFCGVINVILIDMSFVTVEIFGKGLFFALLIMLLDWK